MNPKETQRREEIGKIVASLERFGKIGWWQFAAYQQKKWRFELILYVIDILYETENLRRRIQHLVEQKEMGQLYGALTYFIDKYAGEYSETQGQEQKQAAKEWADKIDIPIGQNLKSDDQIRLEGELKKRQQRADQYLQDGDIHGYKDLKRQINKIEIQLKRMEKLQKF